MRTIVGRRPPPSLPHEGGGAARWVWPRSAKGTEEHPPLDGEGWGGVTLFSRKLL